MVQSLVEVQKSKNAQRFLVSLFACVCVCVCFFLIQTV